VPLVARRFLMFPNELEFAESRSRKPLIRLRLTCARAEIQRTSILMRGGTQRHGVVRTMSDTSRSMIELPCSAERAERSVSHEPSARTASRAVRCAQTAHRCSDLRRGP